MQVMWCHEGEKHLASAAQKQVQAVQWLALILEICPAQKNYSMLKKSLTCACNDLLMRSIWALAPESLEARLLNRVTSTHEEDLQRLLDTVLQYCGSGMSAEEIFLHKRALKAQLLGASCKALMVLADASIADTKTPAWTGEELARVTKEHLPTMFELLCNYNALQDESMFHLIKGIELLIRAQHRWQPRAVRHRLHHSIDFCCRSLVSIRGLHPQDLIQSLKRFTFKVHVRARICSRLWFFLLEKTTLFAQAAAKAVQKRQWQRRTKASKEAKQAHWADLEDD